jgi:hypothetical protein
MKHWIKIERAVSEELCDNAVNEIERDIPIFTNPGYEEWNTLPAPCRMVGEQLHREYYSRVKQFKSSATLRSVNICRFTPLGQDTAQGSIEEGDVYLMAALTDMDESQGMFRLVYTREDWFPKEEMRTLSKGDAVVWMGKHSGRTASGSCRC